MPLTITPPDGAHFDFEEVKTEKGTKSLGDVPLLVWDDLDKARAYYGDEAICMVLDGTSLRVSFQGTARRMKIAGKEDDEIAKSQIDFRPGKRAVGAATPQSRLRAAAAKAGETIGNADVLTKLLERIQSGEISEDDVAALAGI